MTHEETEKTEEISKKLKVLREAGADLDLLTEHRVSFTENNKLEKLVAFEQKIDELYGVQPTPEATSQQTTPTEPLVSGPPSGDNVRMPKK